MADLEGERLVKEVTHLKDASAIREYATVSTDLPLSTPLFAALACGRRSGERGRGRGGRRGASVVRDRAATSQHFGWMYM